jgi:hypothetical protein
MNRAFFALGCSLLLAATSARADLAPYSDPAKPWPKQDLVAGDRARIFPLLARFAPPDALYRLLWP